MGILREAYCGNAQMSVELYSITGSIIYIVRRLMHYDKRIKMNGVRDISFDVHINMEITAFKESNRPHNDKSETATEYLRFGRKTAE